MQKLLRKYELGEESMSAQMVLEAIKEKKPKSYSHVAGESPVEGLPILPP